MVEAFIHSMSYFGNPTFLWFLVAGVIIGIIFGIIPGIGGLLALSILLPFTYVMTPTQGLSFLLAITAVSFTGGSITAILLNIPGTNPNSATLFDGFPMARKGQAGRALGAALAASGLGGLLSGLIALVCIPLILPMVMAIGTGDMVFIILIGLSFIGALAGASPVKGLIGGGLGLLFSFIGFQALTGAERFTFGNLYLYDGFKLIPMALGLFALPEMIGLAVSGGRIADADVAAPDSRQVWEGCKDVFRHWGVFLRGTVIGWIIGVVPGVGAETSPFLAYGSAKQTSKHPELFGTGIVEGVIAPESSNNATIAGALLTTLALGIPGSSTMALIIGAMWMLGIVPGPQVLTEHLDLSLALMNTVIVANVLAAVICILAAPHLAKVAKIPSAFLTPLVIILILVGAFSDREYFTDILITLIFTVLGLAMKNYGYSRPALVLGFVLGFMFEKYFFTALHMSGPLFFMTPISLTCIFLVIALFAYNPIMRRLRQRRAKTA